MTGDEVHVFARVMLRHPDLTVDDVVYAWHNVVLSAPRLGSEPTEYIAIGPDPIGRMLEIVAVALPDASGWVIKHAQRPPQEGIRRELGLGRR